MGFGTHKYYKSGNHCV